MAATLDIPQTVSPVDALWTLIMSQTKSVRKELMMRLSALEHKKAKTKNELDLALEEIKQGKTVTFANADDAIAYLNN